MLSGTMSPAAIEAMIDARVAAALANHKPLQSQELGTNSEVNGEDHRRCNYENFLNCKPNSFFGIGGVIELTRWVEETESAFAISFCTEECKAKFAACTLMGSALTWWNKHVQVMGLSATNALTWIELKMILLAEYYPRSEVRKLKREFRNLTMKGSEIQAYTTRFTELAVLCPVMVNPEYKKVERYIWGLAPHIQSMVTSASPATFESAKALAIQLADEGIRQGAMTRRTETPREENNERKPWNNNNHHRNNNNSNSRQISAQGPPKRQHTTTAHAAIPINTVAPRRKYVGKLPKCNKCNFHHTGACREFVCTSCKKHGHTARYCRGTPVGPAPNVNTGANRACYRGDDSGHFNKDCPRQQG